MSMQPSTTGKSEIIKLTPEHIEDLRSTLIEPVG